MKQLWQYQFSKNILSRGETYFYNDRVHHLDYQQESDAIHFQASVQGSHLYYVSGTLKDEILDDAHCTCPYDDFGRCKHVAATLYALEYDLEIQQERERRQMEEEARKRRMQARTQIHPFETDTETYHFFDMARITENLVIYDLEYQQALKELESENASLKIDFGYLPRSNYQGLAGTASYGSARMQFGRDKILSMECYDYHCDGYYGGYYRNKDSKAPKEPCRHTLKLLILIDRYLKTHEVGDNTDYHALQFLNIMRSDVIQNAQTHTTASAAEAVHLIPRVTKDSHGLLLSFRIGKEKLYAVKNLTTLVNAVQRRQEYPLGKNQALDFRTDTFDASGQRFYQLIRGRLEELRSMQKHAARMYYIPDLSSTLELTGSNLDTLFQAGEHYDAEFVNKLQNGRAKPLRFSQNDPEIRLAIRRDCIGDTFHGIKLEGNLPAFLNGADGQYYLEESPEHATLYRISEGAVKKLDPLERFGMSGEISLSIGRKHLSEFYYDILPALQDSLSIDEPDAAYIESQMPPKAEFIIYLDAENKLPVLRMESIYKEEIFPTDDFVNGTPKGLSPIRDAYRESQAISMVLRYFSIYDRETHLFTMEDDERKIYHLLNSGLKEFTAFCEVRSTARFDALRIRSVSKIKVGVSIQSDLMDLTISSGDLSPEELLELLKSYKLKRTYHRLSNGEFIRLDDNIAELSAMVDALHLTPKEFIQGKIHMPAYRALYLDKMLENMSGIVASRDKYFRELIKNFKTVRESDFEVPASLSDTLRPYQSYGYKWLRVLASCNFGGILADDMGLGKTLQMISVLLAAKEEGENGTSLIICPASLVYNWAEEFHRFAPDLRISVISGTKAERAALLDQWQTQDVLITSYDLLKRDVPFYEGKQFAYQVLDEAQFIKTHTTAAAKSVKIIESRHRFALTGTPIENRLSELWSIFDYLMPGFLYKYETFRKEFETPMVKNADADAAARLKRMVSPFILRRLKGDVLKDLPEKLEEIRYARFSSEQQKLYDAQVVKLRGMIGQSDDSQINKNKIEILAELTRARQICCDPSLLFENYTGESAKKEACLDLVRSAIQGEHRILLFSQFTSMLEILEKAFQEEGISYYKITGATPKQERLQLVKAFNEGDVPLFLISLKAGGTGLNLTGADIVIHYDPWWNVAAQNQATDRAHRIGQTRTVGVYKLIAQGSIEEKIIGLQKDKEKLADEILSGESQGISGMSKQDLLDLLEC